jgi:hypothetical protein
MNILQITFFASLLVLFSMSSAYAEAPSAPTSFAVDHASITGKSVPLTWTAPSSGGDVDHYVLQGGMETSPGTYSGWLDLPFSIGVVTSYTLDTSEAPDGVYYRLRLVAETASDESSTASNIVYGGGVPNEPKDYASAVTFLEGRHFADMQDFAAVNTFGANSNFDEATKFAAEQDFTAAQIFDKYQYFDDSTDFTAIVQTFATGTSFGDGTTFKSDGTQSLVAGTIPSFGVMLDSFACDSASCLPSDTSKFLAPGDLLASGVDPVATYTKIKPTDKTLTIDGLGLTMTFETVSTAGTVKTDLYDPALVPDSTVASGGKISMGTSNAGTIETVGSVIDLTPEKTKVGGTAASTSGTIIITMPYKEANIPSGTAEADLTMLHYVGGAWKTEDSCTVDTVNNQITCTVTSLSPFGIGGAGSTSSSGGSVGHTFQGKSCDSNGFGNNNSLRVYQVSYDIDTYQVQVQAYSTCGSISVKMTTPTQQSILRLSAEQPLLYDKITLYSGYLDESEEKFNILVQNNKQSFDETFYIHDKSIIKKYMGTTGYSSEQQGTALPTVTSEQTTILSEPSVEETVLVENEKPIVDEETVLVENEKPIVDEEPLIEYSPEPTEEKSIEVQINEEGGGCLIATATYGSEMANEVQQLRELRDNQLLQTSSGTAFMETFNDVYYSFSPIIADYERENPYFKEAVKLAITPMISTLSLMENANSESEVLSIGISVIVLNLGMYLGVPAIIVIGIRKRF